MSVDCKVSFYHYQLRLLLLRQIYRKRSTTIQSKEVLTVDGGPCLQRRRTVWSNRRIKQALLFKPLKVRKVFQSTRPKMIDFIIKLLYFCLSWNKNLKKGSAKFVKWNALSEIRFRHHSGRSSSACGLFRLQL